MTEDEWAEAAADDRSPRPPEQGVADMTRLLTHLEKRRATFLRRVADGSAASADTEVDLIRQIQSAQTRLAEYQTQLKGRN